MGHSADRLDHDTLLVLPDAHRPHSPQSIPSPPLALRDLVLHLPSPILQMRASVRHAGASKRENCTLVKKRLFVFDDNRGKRGIIISWTDGSYDTSDGGGVVDNRAGK